MGWDATNPVDISVYCLLLQNSLCASHVVESNKLWTDTAWLSSDHSYWNAFRTMEKDKTLCSCMALLYRVNANTIMHSCVFTLLEYMWL